MVQAIFFGQPLAKAFEKCISVPNFHSISDRCWPLLLYFFRSARDRLVVFIDSYFYDISLGYVMSMENVYVGCRVLQTSAFAPAALKSKWSCLTPRLFTLRGLTPQPPTIGLLIYVGFLAVEGEARGDERHLQVSGR